MQTDPFHLETNIVHLHITPQSCRYAKFAADEHFDISFFFFIEINLIWCWILKNRNEI